MGFFLPQKDLHVPLNGLKMLEVMDQSYQKYHTMPFDNKLTKQSPTTMCRAKSIRHSVVRRYTSRASVKKSNNFRSATYKLLCQTKREIFIARNTSPRHFCLPSGGRQQRNSDRRQQRTVLHKAKNNTTQQ